MAFRRDAKAEGYIVRRVQDIDPVNVMTNVVESLAGITALESRITSQRPGERCGDCTVTEPVALSPLGEDSA